MKPIYSSFFELHRNIDKYDCNKLNKLLLESLLFNLLFNYKGGNSSKNNNNRKNKLNLSANVRHNYTSLNTQRTNISMQRIKPPEYISLNPNNTSYQYTLVLDLDETMVHYFFVRSL